jgi:tetratricopeptide (TPR) repeat protein
MIFRENNAEQILLYAKLPLVLVSIALGITIFLWSRELYGAPAAVGALFLYALDPNILAHTSVAQTDLAFSAFYCIASYFFWRALQKPTLPHIAGAAFFCACTTITKFSFINLFLTWSIVGAGYLLFAALAPGDRSRAGMPMAREKARRLALIIGAAAAVSYVAVWTIYGFRWDPTPDGRIHFPIATVMPTSPAARSIAEWVSNSYLLPEAAVYGFLFVLKFLHRISFLSGAVSTNGFWLFFPLAFAVKTPVATLLLIAATPTLWIFNRRIGAAECFLAAHVLIYFAIALASPINIGLRHILPIYPFLFVLLGGSIAALWGMKDRWVRGALALAALWYASSAAYIYPHYLAYFNELWGGPKNGYKILVDSNLDWGQDLKGLKAFLEQNRIERVYLSYFGTADICHYGIRYIRAPGFPDPPLLCDQPPEKTPPEFLAVSATNLQSVYLPDKHTYDWLKSYTPVAQIGYTIFVYNIKGDARAHKNLAEGYLKSAMIADAQREFALAGESLTDKQLARVDLGDKADPYVNLGAAFYEKGMIEEATALFERAVALDAKNSEAHTNLGGAYLGKNRIDEAIAEFDAALKINPKNVEAHNNIGTAYLRKGRPDIAYTHYSDALRLKPEYKDAQENFKLVDQGRAAQPKR